MKKMLCFLLSMVLLAGSFGMSANAQGTVYPRVSHTYTTTEDLASDDWSVDLRGVHLGSGTSVIARAGTNKINISGATNASHVCDKVYLTLHVERSTSYATGYSTYKTYAYSAEDVYALAKGISNITVERGYYYRVRGVHVVTMNGTTEATDSLTNPLDYR